MDLIALSIAELSYQASRGAQRTARPARLAQSALLLRRRLAARCRRGGGAGAAPPDTPPNRRPESGRGGGSAGGLLCDSSRPRVVGELEPIPASSGHNAGYNLDETPVPHRAHRHTRADFLRSPVSYRGEESVAGRCELEHISKTASEGLPDIAPGAGRAAALRTRPAFQRQLRPRCGAQWPQGSSTVWGCCGREILERRCRAELCALQERADLLAPGRGAARLSTRQPARGGEPPPRAQGSLSDGLPLP
nr:PREDICTED: uncharacterized protein LOC107079980 [Lepisosteus oculatus]